MKATAAKHGRSKEEIALITDDSDSSEFAGDMAQKELTGTKCVTLTKLWRGENGTICFRKSVRDTVITETIDKMCIRDRAFGKKKDKSKDGRKADKRLSSAE